MANENIRGGKSNAENVTDRGVRLPDEPVIGVILSNHNYDNSGIIELDVNSDSYKTSGNEIYWGFSDIGAHALYPGQTTDFVIPCTNAQQIHLKTNTGITRRIFYTLLKG